jgi:uroporphyrinogen-III synthase
MSLSVLLTAAVEDTEQFRAKLEEEEAPLLHYPLERYEALEEDSTIAGTLNNLDQFENIVHGSKRNARFFVEKVEALGQLEQARQQLNLALNQHTADYLERKGIPAIHPQAQGKAINLMEFMLRVRRLGETLYPCGDKTSEDLPGFLQELDIPVQELVLFTLEGPAEKDLQGYQKQLMQDEPGVVIFHSRRSVNRMLAAFPKLNYEEATVISGDQAVSDKLEKQDIEVNSQASGSWDSIFKKIIDKE